MSDPLHIYTEQYESFILYTCVSGEVSIQWHAEGKTENVLLKTGEAILIPAEMPDFFIVPRERDSFLLETYVSREDVDPYINPNVPSSIEGQDD